MSHVMSVTSVHLDDRVESVMMCVVIMSLLCVNRSLLCVNRSLLCVNRNDVRCAEVCDDYGESCHACYT